MSWNAAGCPISGARPGYLQVESEFGRGEELGEASGTLSDEIQNSSDTIAENAPFLDPDAAAAARSALNLLEQFVDLRRAEVAGVEAYLADKSEDRRDKFERLFDVKAAATRAMEEFFAKLEATLDKFRQS